VLYHTISSLKGSRVYRRIPFPALPGNSLLKEEHRNVILHRVDHPAGRAGKPGRKFAAEEQDKPAAAAGTGQNAQEFRIHIFTRAF
jgi:hypothetical protein